MRTLKALALLLCMQITCIQAFAASQTEQDDAAVSEVIIKNGDGEIYGVLSKPKNGKDKQPIIIIAHGFNGTHHFGKNYFKAMNEIGYQCYTFDFPGGSAKSRSDNNTMNMSILDEQTALENIIDHFKKQPDVDADNIVLLGESQGGLVSALTAASKRKDVSKLVLIFPALCIPDNWRARYPEVESIPDTTRLWNVPMGKRFFSEIHDMDVFKIIGKFKKPVIIIQGDKDPIVSLHDSQRAVEIYKNATLDVIKGAGHGFNPQDFNYSLKKIQEFLQ